MSSCACYPGDYERASVESTQIRTARKPHECCECDDVIAPGQKYEVWAGCWEGKWERFKTCMFCVAVARDFFDGERIFGTLGQCFRDCLGWDYREAPEDWEEEGGAE